MHLQPCCCCQLKVQATVFSGIFQGGQCAQPPSSFPEAHAGLFSLSWEKEAAFQTPTLRR